MQDDPPFIGLMEAIRVKENAVERRAPAKKYGILEKQARGMLSNS